MMRAWLLLGCVAHVVVGGACADAASPEGTPCIDDDVCPSPLVCAFGSCLDPNDQRLSIIDVETEPPTASGVPVQATRAIDLRETSRIPVALVAGVDVGGSVDVDGAGIAARVVFRPRDFIAGRAIAATAIAAEDGTFHATLVQDQRYAWSVEPVDASIPPRFDDDGFDADGGSDGAQTLDAFSLSPSSVVVAGRAVAGAGAAVQGIPALEVRLVRDGRVLSSTATTDDDGAFSLVLPQTARDLILEVRPTVENAFFPTVALGGIDVTGASLDLGDVDLGDVVAPTRVGVRVRNADGSASAQAKVVLVGQLGNGAFRTQLITDDAGAAVVDLVPAAYDVALVGAPGEPNGGLLLTDVVISPGSSEAEFVLPNRGTWRGTVVSASGDNVGAASLTFVRVGDEAGDLEPVLQDQLVVFSAASAADGAFSVALDPGRYRVQALPPPASGLPGTSALFTVGRSGLGRDLVLPPRAIVAGTVQFDGDDVAGAYVRVFSTLLDERGVAILIGQGISDASGAFTLAVPDLTGGIEDLE